MPRSILAAALAMGGILLALPLGAAAQDKLPVDQIEKIVKDYLMREPEVIYQAIQELQKRQQAEEATRQQVAITEQADQIFRHEADPIAGNADGDVTLVEFFDYHCGYCRSMTSGLQQLVGTDKNLRFVFKELPVLGPDSVVAAKAALAAAKIDESKYYDFHLALMRSKELSRDAIFTAAVASGYDKDQLAAEMEQDWVKTRLDENHALAEKLGINGTPSFVVGKTLIPGAVDLGKLAQLVQDERTAAN
jgi:protein-disulfide isomerase